MHRIRAEDGDAAIVQPRNALRRETGKRWPFARIGPIVLAPGIAANRDEEDVALAHLHVLSGFGSGEFTRGHGLSGIDIRHAAQAWDVEQHAAATDAVLRGHDAT